MTAHRSIRYAGLGATMSFGAPLGWAALRWIDGSPPWQALAADPALFAYLLFGTAIAFASFGAMLGLKDEHLVVANARLTELAVTDELTGLKNVRYFHERLLEASAQSHRSRQPLSLVMLDLDHFKQVNDQHGHGVGDEVLTQTAHTIASVVRTGDSACRVGGEEFAIVCPQASLDDALRVAERIRAAVEAYPLATSSGELRITVSAGVATAEPSETPLSLFRRADQALYAAKGAGRNRVSVSPAIDREKKTGVTG